MTLEEDPVLSILLLGNQSQSHSYWPSFLKDSSIDNDIPVFHSDSIKSACEKHNAGARYKDVLLELGFKYKFDKDLLTHIHKADTKIGAENQQETLVTLFSFVRFVLDEDYLNSQFIIRALFKQLGSYYDSYVLKAIEYIFVNGIKQNLDNFDLLFPFLQDYFERYTTFAKSSQRILVTFLKKTYPHGRDSNNSSDYSDKAMKLMKFLIKFSLSNPCFFYSKIASDLIYAVCSKFAELDMLALQLFSAVSESLDEASAISLLMILPMRLRDFILNEKPFLSVTDSKNNIIDAWNFINSKKAFSFPKYHKNVMGKYEHPTATTFENGLDIKLPIDLNDKPQLSSMLSDKVRSRIILIGQAIIKHPKAQESLFEWMSQAVLESHICPHFFDIATAFITFFSLWSSADLLPKFWTTLYHSMLFDPRINAFEKNGLFPLFDKLRALVLSTVASIHGFEYLTQLVESLMEKPALVAEMIRRIIDLIDEANIDVLTSQSLVMHTCSIALYFQDVHFKVSGTDAPIQLIESTRSIIFIFIAHIINDPELSNAWFGFGFFKTALFVFTFEQPVRSYILSLLKSYMVRNIDAVPQREVLKSMIELINITFQNFPNEKDIDMGNDFMQTINEVMSHSPTQIKECVDLVEPVCISLSKLTDTPQCDKFLIEALHFFAIVAPAVTLNPGQLSAVSAAVKAVEPNELSGAVITNMKQISAGNQIPSVSPFFLVRQPKALRTLLYIAKSTSSFEQVVDFVYSLVEFTFQNAIILSRAGVDMMLLETIDEWKGHKISQFLLDSVFKIITQISLVVSSTLLVHRFIHLMFPIEDTHVSSYQPFFIKKMIELTSTAMRTPAAYLPIGGGTTLEVEGVTSEFFGNMYIATAWIYVDRCISQAHAKIVEVLDRKIRGFNLFVSSGNLLFTCFSKTIESTARFDLTLPRGCWTHVAIAVCPGRNGRTAVTATVDDVTSRRIEFTWPGFKDGPISVVVGDSQVITNRPVLVSSFSVTKFDETTGYTDFIADVFEAGPRAPGPPRYSLDTAVISHEGSVAAVAATPNGNLKTVLHGEPLLATTSFIEVLVSLSKVKVVIPLFSLFDVPSVDGKILTEIPDLVFDLLMSILSISEGVQSSFYNSKGFEIIEHLLHESKTFRCSYNAYIRFYSMLQSITLPELQIKLIKHILCSYDLLSEFDLPGQLRIIKHWRRVLFPAYPRVFAISRPIRDLISLKVDRYEKDGKMYEPIRKNLMDLITDVSMFSLELDDFYMLVSEAVRCITPQRLQSYLDILVPIFVRDDSQGINQLRGQLTNLILLNHTISVGEGDALVAISMIAASAHRRRLLPNISSQHHFELIMQAITPGSCTQDATMCLIHIANNGCPDILPLAVYVAINAGDDALFEAFDELKPVNLSQHSRMWVTAAAAQAASDVRSKILEFIIDCGVDWSEAASMIFVVCSALDEEPANMINEFLMKLSKRLIKQDNSDPSEVDAFFALAQDKLLYHPMNNSLALAKEFAASPFATVSYNSVFDDDVQSNECSFSRIRVRSMASRMFIFVDSNENIKNSVDFDSDSIGELKRSSSQEYLITHKILPPTTPGTPPKRRLSDSMGRDCSTSFDRANSSQSPKRKSLYEESPLKPAFLFKPSQDVELEFSMNTLYEKIESFVSHRRDTVFILRRDKNGQWLDLDLAKSCLELFQKNQSPLYFSFDLTLAAFLLKTNQPLTTRVVEQHLSQLTATSSQLKACRNILSFLKCCAGDTKMDIPIMKNVVADESRKIMALNEIAAKRSSVCAAMPYRLAENMSRQNLSMIQIHSEFVNLENTENLGFSLREIRRFNTTERARAEESTRVWNRLWRSLTMQLGPWEGAQRMDAKDLSSFDRDMTLCAHLVPVRKRRRWNVLDTAHGVKISIGTRCVSVRGRIERHGSIEVSKDSCMMYFRNSRIIQGSDIRFVMLRSRFHQDIGLEIVLWNGRNRLIEFKNESERNDILRKLKTIAVKAEYCAEPGHTPRDMLNAIGATQRWIDCKLSNFEYLILVNFAAGRSFNDPNQYPIFPWVISDYESTSINLKKSDQFRDMRKPIGATDEDCLSKRRGKQFLFEHAVLTSDHVNSVLDGVSSIADLYNSSVREAFELPPEAFCMPEIFENSKLPPWAKSASEFVYMNRLALESQFVSLTLQMFIDLIFGTKQRGKEARGAKNDSDSTLFDGSSPGQRERLTSLGIIPKMVFNEPHPERRIRVDNDWMSISINSDLNHVMGMRIDENTSNLGALQLHIVESTGTIRTVAVDLKERAVCQVGHSVHFNTTFAQEANAWETAVPIGNSFAVTSGSSSTATVVGVEPVEIRTLFGTIRGISGGTRFLATVCTDMTTRIWDTHNMDRPHAIIPSFRDYTICAELSERFGIAVTGTRDGSLQLCALGTGTVQKVIDLDRRKPMRILITPGMGNILVYAENMDSLSREKELLVYTVNGSFTGRVPLNSKLCSWCVWEDERCIDHVCLSLENKKVYVFELLSLTPGQPFYRLKDPSKVLSVARINERFVIVSISIVGDIDIIVL